MGTTQLDIIRTQLEAAARNQVSKASAGVRRSTSLVGEAHRLTGRAQRRGEEVTARLGDALRARRGAARRGTSTVPGPAQPPRPAADGYTRRTPVQPLYVAADYKKRIFRKILGLAVAVALLLFLLWLILNSKLLTQ